MIYTVTFNPAVDYVLRLSELVPGQMNRPVSEKIRWGGKGINVSAVLKMLGVESTALGFAAGFTGRALEDAVRASGINTDFIDLPEGFTRICVKLFEENGSRETEINPGGPFIGKDAIEKLLDRLSRLERGDVLILAGSVPGSVPSDIYETVCQRLCGRGVMVAADASGDLLTNLLRYKPFAVKPNQYEASEICGFTVDSHDKAEKCALYLKEQGAENVIVSMAGDGAVLAAGDGRVYHIGAPKGTVVNSVGAGDSMLAGFIAGYMKTGDYAEALRWGTASGSATAFSKELACREDFDRILKELEV